MKDLSIKAKGYILSSIFFGGALLVWNLFYMSWGEIWMLLALSVIASLTLILKVVGATGRSHYNISFLVYGFTFLLLGPEEAIFVILISNLVEWAWHRYPWYIQSFNIASYVIAMHSAGLMYRHIMLLDGPTSLLSVVGILTALAAFTLINHLMVGVVIWLARRENFSQSGVLDFFPLMLDFTLLCMGAGTALLYEMTPFAIILVLLPLYLIYTTLKVPALERKTETDPKTGLFNAEYFNQALEEELKRANRFDRPLTVVMADLDLLRNINNTYGHLAGDEVLIGVANIFMNSVREYDVVSRFGGEEYAIMMPETTPEMAYPRIEAIRQEIERAEFTVLTSITPIKATMSFGISSRDERGYSVRDIIHNADTALYHAKLKGRNGTFIYSEDGVINLFGQDRELISIGVDSFSEEGELEAGLADRPAQYGKGIEEKVLEADNRKVKKIDSPKVNTPLPNYIVNLFIGILTVITMSLFYIVFIPGLSVDWFGLSVFSAMVVLTEWLAIDLYLQKNSVSTSAIPMLAGILLFGPLGALLLSIVFSVTAWLKHHGPPNRLVFNFSNQLLAGLLYLGVISLIGVTYLELSTWTQVVMCLFSIGIVYISTTLLIAFGMSLDMGLSMKEIWEEKFKWLAPHYLVMGVITYALIFSYQMAGVVGTMVVLIPILLIRFSQKQYIDRTSDMVNELRIKNVALEQSSKEINRLNEGLLDTLAEVVDLRDPYVLGHSKQVAHYAVLLAQRLGLSERKIDLMYKAGLLHDIGKLGISESILFKPDRLTDKEYEIVKKHSELGADLLKTSHALGDLVPIIRHHHEHFDGSGYPDKLIGHTIPIEARILSVADAIEAMASDRPYRRGLTEDEIVEELERCSGSQFDPLMVRAFIEVIQKADKDEKVVSNSARRVQLTYQEPAIHVTPGAVLPP
jgi:diguanylate cyclase (GGDEF)-like protein/putative nucleotidyltransferase with HDIG domain